MRLLDFKVKRFKVPLYDIFAFTAGFSIGYSEVKGIDTGPAFEYLTKYGPTAFATTITPFILKKKSNDYLRDLQYNNVTILFQGDSKKKYRDLNEDEKRKININFKNFESRLNRPEYIKKPVSIGLKTALETSLGYSLGSLLGRL